MATKMFGIDLGTSTIKIYEKNKGIVLDESNMIAIEGNKIRAVGDEAYEMYGKVPPSIEVSSPIQKGVIADVKNMVALINVFMKRIIGPRRLMGSSFLISTPTDITEVEKRAFFELISNSNIKTNKIKTIEKPLADALGIGLDVASAEGIMIINIGADTTEISILSLSGIVLSKLIPIGGNKINQSIKSMVKRKYNLYIGEKTAELLKRELATAIKTSDESSKTYGRDVVTGLPVQVEISSQDIFDSISENLYNIIDSLKMILEKTPPEIASDIIENGIYVSGGSALIKNLDQLMEKETELKINICEDPANTIVKGMGVVMEDPAYENLCKGLQDNRMN